MRNIDQKIESVAADWAIKQSGGLSASDQDAFFQWLAQDPRHGERYARYREGWSQFNRLAEWRPEHSEEPNPDLLEVKQPTRVWIAWGFGGMALAAALAIVFRIGLGVFESDVLEDRANGLHIVSTDYVYQVLSDGSEIDMRQGAEVSIAFTDDERVVELLSGEVYFTVAENPDRPFIVDVGTTQVRAVGTAFNVKRDMDQIDVLVTEGKVRVDRQLSLQSASQEGLKGRRPGSPIANLREKTPLPKRSDIMVSGQRMAMPLEPERLEASPIANLNSAEIEELLFWKHVLLDFEDRPLEEVAREFNRRNETQLVLVGSSLKELPINLSFRSNDLEGFVHLLETHLNIKASRSENGAIVLESVRVSNRSE